MSWIQTRMPERGQKQVFFGSLAITLLLAVVAALTSRSSDWHPLSLFLILLAFGAVAEFLGVRRQVTRIDSPLIISSSAPTVLALTLMGPAPALAIVCVGLVISAVHEKTAPWDIAANFANLSLCVVPVGLLARAVIESTGTTPDQLGFALIFSGAFALVTMISFAANTFSGHIAYGDTGREQWELEKQRLGAEMVLGLFAAATAYGYGRYGLGALSLLALMQLAQLYIIGNLVLAEDRAESLRRRTEELTELHSRLQEQTQRLSEVSRSRGRLVGQVLQAEESERRRLAEALHDESLQDLLSARHGLESGSEAGAERARDSIGRAIKQLRGTIFDLHPAVLEHAGLAAALHEVAENQAQRAGFRAKVAVEPDACGAHDPLLFVLGREQLTNAAKHARATEVALALSRENGQVVMEVSDDGCGIDPELLSRAVEGGHIGLASSAERVEALGGELQIDSEPGRGTRIRTTLPVNGAH